jgi:NAD(P)-dependent dehydrogenase (short-subunit alcohol dehydrogenase family)
MTSRILITGGASGFGQSLARIYAARGERVLVADLAPATGSATDSATGSAVDLPAATGVGEVAYLQLDVRDMAAWQDAKRWVEEQWGGLDLLVNNAGVAAGGRIDVVPLADWERMIDVNLLGTVRGCAAFAPLFKAQRSGRIVNVASLAGLVHPPNMSCYNAVKAAVVALSETLLHELSPYDVDVSVVCPSFFRTNLARSLPGSDPALEERARRLITESRQSAATVAKRTVRKLDAGRFLIRPQVEAVALHNLKRFAAPVYHATFKRVAARTDNKARREDSRLTRE